MSTVDSPTLKTWDVSWADSFGTPWDKIMEAIASGDTWASLSYLGINANPMDEYNTTWPYRNLLFQARVFCPITDNSGYGYTQVQRKADGYPVSGSSFVIVLATECRPEHAGTYSFSVVGNNAPTAGGNGSLSGVTYSGVTNKTTGVYTMPSTSGGVMALRFDNVTADFGNLEFMQPGFVPGDPVLFTPVALAHYQRAKFIRGMDRLKINGLDAASDQSITYLLSADQSFIHPFLTYSRTGSFYVMQQNGTLSLVQPNELPRAYDSALGWNYRFDPSWTQLALHTHSFSNAAWTKFRVQTMTQAVTGPNGTTDAWALTEDTQTASGHYLEQSIAFTSGVVYSVIAVVAPTTGDRYVSITLPATAFGSNAIATFDLSNGTSVKNATAKNTASVQLSNGYWIISMSATATVTVSGLSRIRLCNVFDASQQTYDGNGTSGIKIWAFNVTNTDYRVPIVSATTATVTIGNPSLSMPAHKVGFNIGNGGCLGFKGRAFYQTTATPSYISLRSSTQDSSTHAVEYNDSATLNVVASVRATNTTSFSSSATQSGNYKYAMRFKPNDFRESRNGTSTATDTAGALPSGIDTIRIGSNGTNILSGGISQVWVCGFRVINAVDTYMTDVAVDYMSSTTGGGGWSANLYQGSKVADRFTTGYKNSLKGLVDMTSAMNSELWCNIPDQASNRFISDYIDELLTFAPAPAFLTIEDTNEPWNSGFQAWANRRNEAFATADIITSNTDANAQVLGPKILSAVRASNTVTVTLSAAPTYPLTTGSVIYHKLEADVNVTNAIAAGTATCIAGTSGAVIKFVLNGADRTAALSTTWYDTYIYPDPTHELVTPVTNYGLANVWPDPITVMFRYNATRLRAIYDKVSAAGALSRVRIVQGTQLTYRYFLAALLPWMEEKWGNLNWLNNNGGGFVPAYYATPSLALEDTQTNTDNVFIALEDGRATANASLIKMRNLLKTFGLDVMRGYEAGPHNDQKHTTEIAAAVRAAHNSDPRMKTLLVGMWQDWLNRNGSELCYFHGGWTATYDGISYGGSNNNTWALREGSAADAGGYQPKDSFFTDQQNVAASPTTVTGVNYGLIYFTNVVEPSSGQDAYNSCITINANAKLKPYKVLVYAPSTGNYTVEVMADAHFYSPTMTVKVDSTTLGAVALASGNVYDGTQPSSGLSTTVDLAKGFHWIEISFPAAPRTEAIALYTLNFYLTQYERLVVNGSTLLSSITNEPVFLRGPNQGTWGTNYAQDAVDIAATGANCVRLVLRWWGNYPDENADARTSVEADGYINPANLSQFKQEIQWAVDNDLWVVVAFDSDCGQNGLQDTAYCDPEGIYPTDGHNFWTDLAVRELFKTAWKKLASELQEIPKIAMYELLPEPLDNRNNTWADDIRDFYRDLISAVREVDTVTPFLIGPRGAYEVAYTDEAWLSERTDVIYTADLLDPKVINMDELAAKMEILTTMRQTRNVPVLVQQVGRRTVNDTTLVAMRHAMSGLNANKIHYNWWQWHQNTINPDEYALYYKDGVGGWTPKTNELTAFEYFMGETFQSVETAAIAAATAAGGQLYYVKSDLSNVFQDNGTATPCTAAGQAVGRLMPVVGTNYFTQGTQGSKPSLVQGVNGLVMQFDGTDDWMGLDSVYFATDDTNQFVIAACRAVDSASNRVIIQTGTSAATVRFPYLAVLATDLGSASWRGDDNVLQSLDSTTNCSDRALVLTGSKVGNDKKVFVNGAQESTTNSNTVGSVASLTRTRIGGSTALSNFFQGPIAMIYVGKSLTTAQQTAIERLGAYLIGAPFKGALP